MLIFFPLLVSLQQGLKYAGDHEKIEGFLDLENCIPYVIRTAFETNRGPTCMNGSQYRSRIQTCYQMNKQV